MKIFYHLPYQYRGIRLFGDDYRIAARSFYGRGRRPADGKQNGLSFHPVHRKETLHGTGAEKNN
ncbi:MAG TPA: hypothetical protein VN824_04060, partial [Puia sp.]|nr:hypothetical protein [Puia sp.]